MLRIVNKYGAQQIISICAVDPRRSQPTPKLTPKSEENVMLLVSSGFTARWRGCTPADVVVYGLLAAGRNHKGQHFPVRPTNPKDGFFSHHHRRRRRRHRHYASWATSRTVSQTITPDTLGFGQTCFFDCNHAQCDTIASPKVTSLIPSWSSHRQLVESLICAGDRGASQARVCK